MRVLSKSSVGMKILLPLILSAVASLIILELMKDYGWLKGLLSITALVLGSIWAHRRYSLALELLYNEQQLIIKNKILERIILLRNISRIKRVSGTTRILGLEYQVYRLEFKNERDVMEALNFQLACTDSSLTAFQNLMRKNYPEALIENDTF